MDKHCRLCGSNDAILYNLFDPDENYLHYVKKIHKLLPVVVNEFDPLPKVICHRCAFKISEFYEFRINCIRTQEFFKTRLPWCKTNQTEDLDRRTVHTPMVELKMNSIEHFSPAENCKAASHSNLDDSPIVIEDDDLSNGKEIKEGTDDIDKPVCEPSKDERNTFQVEDQDNSDRLVMKIKKKTYIKKSAVWDAKNSNHFGKRKKRVKKACKIDHIFSTPSSVYQNMSQSDVIDPTEYISAQEHSNDNAVGSKNKSCEASESDNSDNGSRLPSFILVTKIPNVGNAYTCKVCRRTFLAAGSAITHDCHAKLVNKPHLHDNVTEESKTHSARTNNVNSNHDRNSTNNSDLEDMYICDVCNKIFPRQAILLAHKKQHFVTYSSTDSELEIFKNKKNHKRNLKLKLDRQKRRLENETPVRSEDFQDEQNGT